MSLVGFEVSRQKSGPNPAPGLRPEPVEEEGIKGRGNVEKVF